MDVHENSLFMAHNVQVCTYLFTTKRTGSTLNPLFFRVKSNYPHEIKGFLQSQLMIDKN